MAKIIVLAGDIDSGKWAFATSFDRAAMQRQSKDKPFELEEIDLKNEAESVETLTEDKAKKLLGTAGWGVAGALALGPIGAIGGILIGGNKKDVSFVCYLKDGRKFMASTDGKSYQKLSATLFK